MRVIAMSGALRKADAAASKLRQLRPLAVTLHHFGLSEGGAKAQKMISGVLLVHFGILFLVGPAVLGCAAGFH